MLNRTKKAPTPVLPVSAAQLKQRTSPTPARSLRRGNVAVLTAAFILGASLAACIINPASIRSQEDFCFAQAHRTAVMPFIGAGQPRQTKPYPADHFLDLTIANAKATADMLPEDAERILSRLLYSLLKSSYKGTGLEQKDVEETLRQLDIDPQRETLRSSARKLGSALDTEYVFCGIVWRYRERVGSGHGIQRPAAVGFAIVLVDTATGTTAWEAECALTQQSLFENILWAPAFFRLGARWLTAEELAAYCMQQALDDFAY